MNYLKAIASCDERIADINERIRGLTEAYGPIAKCGFMRRPLALDYFDHSLKMVKIEKLIYHSIIQYITDQSKQSIFNKFYEKYNDLLTESLEMLNKMVKKGSIEEKDYLDTCNESLKQQKYIKALCDSKDDIINPSYI